MCLLRTSFFIVLLVFCSGEEDDRDKPEKMNNCTEDGRLTVLVEQGYLRGQSKESAAGGFYYSFQGIPYAEPPVGDLRFKDAIPPRKWEGVRSALKEGNICPQLNDLVQGNEDCLFLNIYTPAHLPKGNSSFPVKVWIHGGGYTYTSGNSKFYGPDYLVSEEVIVVTLNYRLAVLGFLYLEEAAPGNAGLKDQVAAMRWVKRNIAAFKGDPNRITIFGESAGGASVHHHMLSPMTEGLFYAAIAQSGSALNTWGRQIQPLRTSRRLAILVGCPVGNNSATVACLRTIDIDTLMTKAASPEVVAVKDEERILQYHFVPTVDMAVPGVETYLPAPPLQLITEGKHKALPFCMGFNNNESLLISFFEDFFNGSIAQEFDANWKSKILPELDLPVNETNNYYALRTLRNFFMNGQPLTNDTIPGFLDMLTDIYFAKGIYLTLDSIARFRKAALYSYLFTVDDSLNAGKTENEAFDRQGASHGDDLGYLFNMKFLPKVPKESTSRKSRDQMVRMWTNFAKFRNPTPCSDPLLGEEWKMFTSEENNYLEIGSQLRSRKNLNSVRAKFWKEFDKKYKY